MLDTFFTDEEDPWVNKYVILLNDAGDNVYKQCEQGESFKEHEK